MRYYLNSHFILCKYFNRVSCANFIDISWRIACSRITGSEYYIAHRVFELSGVDELACGWVYGNTYQNMYVAGISVCLTTVCIGPSKN